MNNTSRRHLLTRRDLLKLAGALPIAAINGPWLAPIGAAGGQHIAGFDPSLVPATDVLAGWLKQLHDFGPIRATGTPQSRAFEEWLATQLTGLGFTLERDQYKLTSWECDVQKDCSIDVVEDGGAKRSVEVVAYYPFTASTRTTVRSPDACCTAARTSTARRRSCRKPTRRHSPDSIVVVDMPLGGGGGARTADANPLPTFPSPLPAAGGGRSASGAGGRPVMELLQDKCKALVLCFVDIANESGRHNYLPFSDPHRRDSIALGRRRGQQVSAVGVGQGDDDPAASTRN